MAKKKRPSFSQPRTIGRGLGKRRQVDRQLPESFREMKDFVKEDNAAQFEQYVGWSWGKLTSWATGILIEAGIGYGDKRHRFVTEDEKEYPLPDLAVEDKGANRFDTRNWPSGRVWYAAKIVSLFGLITASIERNDAESAALEGIKLGVLAREAKIRSDLIASSSHKGGSKKKIVGPVLKFAIQEVKTDPGLSAIGLWNSLPAHEDEGEVPKKFEGAELIREGRFLVVYYPEGRKRSLTFSSFRRYVTKARKRVSRTYRPSGTK